MKFERISKEKAEKIIVYGKGRAFSMVKLAGTDYTIYHRIYEDTYYDVAELVLYDSENDTDVQVFFLFDPEEVKIIVGSDPEKIIREDIAKEVATNGK